MTPYFRPLVGWLVDRSVGLSEFLTGRVVTLPCSYRSTCYHGIFVSGASDRIPAGQELQAEISRLPTEVICTDCSLNMYVQSV